MYALVAGKDLKSTDIFNEESYRELDRKLRKSRRSGNPPLCTHELAYRNDVILNALNASGLANTKDDRVKVVFYPCYLSEGDHLLNLSMQEAIQGCHLGVFLLIMSLGDTHQLKRRRKAYRQLLVILAVWADFY